MSDFWTARFPFYVPFVVFVGLTIFFAAMSLTRLRGSWFAPLASSASLVLAIQFTILNFFDVPTWRAEILIQRALEIPVLFVVSSLCLAQAGRLQYLQLWLYRLLTAAPAALLAGWLLALAGGMIWPAPVFDVFAAVPPTTFFIVFPASLPMLFYLALLGWLFLRGPRGTNTRTPRLLVRDTAFSISVFGYLMLNANVVAQVAVAAFLSDGPRQTVVTLQLVLQDRLMIVVALGILLAIVLTAAPLVSEGLAQHSYLTLVSNWERFEARRWQLTAARTLRYPTRAVHYTKEAANLLGLSKLERDKAVITVELTAALASDSEDANEVSFEKAEELLDLQRQNEENPIYHNITEVQSLTETLQAAANLSQNKLDTSENANLRGQPWYVLAAIACQDCCLTQTRASVLDGRNCFYGRRFLEAYNTAKETARDIYRGA